MKYVTIICLSAVLLLLFLAACAQNQTPKNNNEGMEHSSTANEAVSDKKDVKTINIKITTGSTELYAALEDNAASRAFVNQMPVTLSMSNLYDREMCYRYGADALPTDNLRSDGYEVGDIAYWPPAGSLVILYKQDGEHFERQHIGHIDNGAEVFAGAGDADVRFELVEDAGMQEND